jgi:hypothetical protein
MDSAFMHWVMKSSWCFFILNRDVLRKLEELPEKITEPLKGMITISTQSVQYPLLMVG